MNTTRSSTIACALACAFALIASPAAAQQDRWENHTNTAYVNALADAGPVLWVATSNGLIRMTKATGACTAFTKANSAMVDNQVNDVAIDSAGRVWMALGRPGNIGVPTAFTVYDGATMQSYAPSLSSASSVTVGRDGAVWCGASSSTGVYRVVYGQLQAASEAWRLGNDVTHLTVDTLGRPWGIFGFNRSIGRLTDNGWVGVTPSQIGMSGEQITSIAPDLFGGMLIAGKDGLMRYDGISTLRLLPTPSGTSDTSVLMVRSDRRGRIWVATPHEIGMLDGGTWTVLSRASLGLADRRITAMITDADDIAWIGTDDGVVRCDGAGAQHYDTHVNGMPANRTHAITFDRDGAAWIGTSEGAAHFDGRTWTAYTSPIPGPGVNGIAIARDAGVWFAADTGVAAFEHGTWRTFTMANAPFPKGRVVAIAFDRAGNCWAGIRGDTIGGFAVARFDGSTWTVFTPANSPLEEDGWGPTAFAIDSSGNVWVGLFTKGAARYDGTKWTVYRETDTHEALGGITSLVVNRAGVLMIGTNDKGIYTFDGASTWGRITAAPGALLSNDVSVVAVDPASSLWIGFSAQSGYDRGAQHSDAGTWTLYNRPNSDLPDGNVSAIAFDHGGGTWFATREGIGVLNNGLVSAVPLPEFDNHGAAHAVLAVAPNPANARADVTYSITTAAHVHLSLVDALGRTVLDIVDEPQTPETHTVAIATEGVAAGWYGLLLRCGTSTVTQPLVIAGR